MAGQVYGVAVVAMALEKRDEVMLPTARIDIAAMNKKQVGACGRASRGMAVKLGFASGHFAVFWLVF
jgi:hypothetical protein